MTGGTPFSASERPKNLLERDSEVTSEDLDSVVELMLEQKKKVLCKELADLPDTNDIVLWSKNKVQYARSKRGSRYRGVSRNGKKWQV